MGKILCTECGAAWPADLEMVYCGKCGVELDQSLPEITDKERRTLTVLFADLGGFTSFSEGRDPERVETLVDGLLTDLGDVVETYGGYVDKYIGDAVMAVFGAPKAHEDDPVRAVRAGFEMRTVVDQFNADTDAALSLSIGINHGAVIWSRVGGREYTVTGDAVNVAQRLESVAGPDTVLVSRSVEERTDHEVVYASRSRLNVDGREEPVQPSVAEQLQGESTGPIEQVRSHSPLLGRDRELEQLTSRYEDEKPRFVAITGEAGIGKSRLLDAFRERTVAKPEMATVISGGCSVHANLPLEPFAEHLLANADTARDERDAGQAVSEAILADLSETNIDQPRRENIAHLLAISADFDVPGARVTDLDAEQLQDAIYDAWVTWLRIQCVERPVVIALEDLHWADESTIDLLATLQDRLTAITEEFEHPVTVVVTARPEWDVPEWVETLELTSLSESEAKAIAKAILEGPVDDEVATFLNEKTGGNPYFIEEVIRYLLDRELLVKTDSGYELADETGTEVTVPQTLTGLLTGRIDALPKTANETLKGASVMGERFWVEMLRSTLDHDVDEEVDTLHAHELVYPRSEPVLPEYDEHTFTHALLRDAAYELLPKAARRNLHGRVADVLVAKLGAEGNPLASLVAYHAERAGQYDRAFRCYWQAGDSAKDAYANEEAINAYEKAISIANEHDIATETDAAAVSADLATVCNNIDSVERASEVVDSGLEVAPADSEVHCRLLSERMTLLQTQSEFDEAIDVAERLRELAESLNLRLLEAEAIHTIGTIAGERGEYKQAEEYHEQSLEIIEAVGDRGRKAKSLHQLGTVAYDRGKSEQADEYFKRSLAIKEDVGDRRGQANTLNELGIIADTRGEYESAQEYYERSLAIKRDVGDRQGQARTLYNLARITQTRGEYEQARGYSRQALDIFRDIGDRRSEGYVLDQLGVAERKRGEYERAREYYQQSLDILEEIGDRRGQGFVLQHLGIAVAKQGEYERAREYYQQSLDIFTDIGDRRGEVDKLNQLATVARRRRNFDAAREFLERASDVLTDLDDREAKIKYHQERATLAREETEYERAKRHLDEARTACDTDEEPLVKVRILLEETRLALARENEQRARKTLDEAQDRLTTLETPLENGRAVALRGRLAVEAGNLDAAHEHWREALTIFEEIGALPDVFQTLEQLVDLARNQGDADRAREWCTQASEVLDDSPEELTALHQEWINRHTTELNS